LSASTTGVITLVGPVSADNAPGIAVSVNRTTKSDRLSLSPIAQPAQRDSVPMKKSISEQTMLGCESAFSQLADPTRKRLLTHCAA
jgi:hypothetical protein